MLQRQIIQLGIFADDILPRVRDLQRDRHQLEHDFVRIVMRSTQANKALSDDTQDVPLSFPPLEILIGEKIRGMHSLDDPWGEELEATEAEGEGLAEWPGLGDE